MERIPPELGAATGQRHELIVEGRKELLYLLGEAAELEDHRWSGCEPTAARRPHATREPPD